MRNRTTRRKTLSTLIMFVLLFALLFGSTQSILAADDVSDSIKTTDEYGVPVNNKMFPSKQAVYVIFGGNLSAGDWTVYVESPEGVPLGNGVVTVEPGNWYQLWKIVEFADTPNNGGNYKVTAVFSGEGQTSKTDTFKVKGDDPISNISITKTVDESSVTVGDTVYYTIEVKNIGDTILEDVVVVDTMLGLNETIDSLAVDETKTYTEAYTHQSIGSIVNTATVSAGDLSESDTATVLVRGLDPTYGLSIQKGADVSSIAVGGTIHYTLRVTNTGDTVLNNVYVDDDKLGFEKFVSTLEPGAYLDYDHTDGLIYLTTIADMYSDDDTVVNTAYAWADEVQPVSDSVTVSVYVENGPVDDEYDINVDKTADRTSMYTGQTVTYTVVVTNTGDYDLEGIDLEDIMVGVATPMLDETFDLAVGASRTFTYTYVPTTTGTLNNTATVRVDVGDEVPLTDSDSFSVTVSRRSSGGGSTPTPEPEPEPEVIIPEPEVPLVVPEPPAPEEEVIIEDEVPLALPKTGGTADGLLVLPALLTAAGYLVTRKRH